MKLFVYDINDHLSSFHCHRLQDAADRVGCSLGDYIEATLKREIFREIFQPPLTKRFRTKTSPRPRPTGGVTAGACARSLAAATERLGLEQTPKPPQSSRTQPVESNSGDKEAAAIP